MPVAALCLLCLLWAGMVLGISFLETPVKFTAPSLTLPVGLDVGRHVFGVFNKVEVAAALLALGLVLLARGGADPGAAVVMSRLVVWLPVAVALLVVLVQTVWLLPVLDARVGVILEGGTPPRAPYHVVYVVLEAAKLACLIAAGTACLLANLPGGGHG
jgi:hypothetical protein